MAGGSRKEKRAKEGNPGAFKRLTTMIFVHENACGVNDTLSENEAGSGFHGLTREEILSKLVSEYNAALFRLLPDGSVPGNPSGVADGEGGFKLATRDLSVIRGWLADPAQQIGVTAHGAQGRTLVVLDVDIGAGKKAREKALIAWAALQPRLPTNTLVVETPSGGRHVYLMVPEALSNRSPWPGIDVRSGKGFVRAIGDTKNGRSYRVIDPSPIADMPEDVLAELETFSEQKAAAEAAAAAREAARAAGRDNAVPWSPEVEGKLRAALWRLHPGKLSGSEWHNLAWALRNTFGGGAYDLFDTWSQQDEHNYDREENGVKWDRRGEPADSMTMAYATNLWKKHGVAGFIDWGDRYAGSTADDWTGATAISGEGDGADDAIVRELLDLLLWGDAPHVTVFEEPYIAALARIRASDEAAYQRWRARLENDANVSYANRRALDAATKGRAKAAREAARTERLRASAERRNRDADEPVVFDTPDAGVDWFNARIAQVNASGKTLIVYDWLPVVDFPTIRDAAAYFEEKRVLVSDDDGKATTVSAFDLWRRSPERRRYEAVAMRPYRFGGNEPDESKTFNLWRGWGAAPAEGSCALFLDHLLNVVCSGNREQYDWLVRWMAHFVQRPQEKPGTVVVLRGKEGTGKDTVAEYMRRIVGDAGTVKLGNANDLIGDFNGHLAQALLINVQEAFWSGDQKAGNVLKNLISETKLHVNRKFMSGFTVDHFARFIFTSNEDWVVPVANPKEARRYFVLEVSDSRMSDKEYFEALYAEMDAGGPAALHHFLLDIDLTGFNVRRPLKTSALRAQAVESLRHAERFLYNLLVSGDLWAAEPDGFTSNVAKQNAAGGVVIARNDLFGMYRREAKACGIVSVMNPGLSQNKLTRAVKTLLPCALPGKAEGERLVVFPSIAECRAAFESYMGGPVPWGDEDDE